MASTTPQTLHLPRFPRVGKRHCGHLNALLGIWVWHRSQATSLSMSDHAPTSKPFTGRRPSEADYVPNDNATNVPLCGCRHQSAHSYSTRVWPRLGTTRLGDGARLAPAGAFVRRLGAPAAISRWRPGGSVGAAPSGSRSRSV